MKVLIISVIAALAFIGFRSYQAENTKVDMYVFELPIAFASSVADVQQENNWVFVGLNQELCAGSDRACRVAVPASLVNNPGTTPTLKSTANIIGSKTGTYAEVTGISGGGTVSNQPD